MLCDRESLFRKSTRVPGAMRMSFGDTPDAVMVMVFVGVGLVGSVGVDDSPAQDRPSAQSIARRVRPNGRAKGTQELSAISPPDFSHVKWRDMAYIITEPC